MLGRHNSDIHLRVLSISFPSNIFRLAENVNPAVVYVEEDV